MRRRLWSAFVLTALAACHSGPKARPDVFDLAFRTETFDLFFDAVAERYPYFEDLDADWDEVVADARRDALDARTREEFIHVVARALSVLDDPHLSLRIPFSRYEELGVPWSIARVEVIVAEGRRFVVVPGIPELLAVDGCPAQLGLLQALLSGPPETPVRLTLGWPDGTVTERTVPRLPLGEKAGSTSSGSIGWDATSSWIYWARIGPLGCVYVQTFDPETGKSSIQEMNDDLERVFNDLAGVESMIVDLQYNTGGSLAVGLAMGNYLVNEPTSVGSLPRKFLGIFPYSQELTMKPRANGFRGPLAVLVNGRTASMAEHLARALQDSGRATLIGERTSGAEAAVYRTEAVDGTLLQFGELPLVPGGKQSFQGKGVLPDREIPLTIHEVRSRGKRRARAAVHNARIRAALEVLGNPILDRHVPGPNVQDLRPGTH